jgi:hypothetical protein
MGWIASILATVHKCRGPSTWGIVAPLLPLFHSNTPKITTGMRIHRPMGNERRWASSYGSSSPKIRKQKAGKSTETAGIDAEGQRTGKRGGHPLRYEHF